MSDIQNDCASRAKMTAYWCLIEVDTWPVLIAFWFVSPPQRWPRLPAVERIQSLPIPGVQPQWAVPPQILAVAVTAGAAPEAPGALLERVGAARVERDSSRTPEAREAMAPPERVAPRKPVVPQERVRPRKPVVPPGRARLERVEPPPMP